jgi:Dolichyl-phosphate-mannose-protein mannosyltransferase
MGSSTTRTIESGPYSGGDLAVIALIGILWTALAFAIDPRGDFPLNDDWGYGLPVKALVERGEIRFTEWNNSILIAQVIWGALFCLPEGFSFTALRISTLVLGLVGLIGMYGLLRQLGTKRTVALFGAGLIGANPLYLNLSYSFMTDVPFSSLAIVSILLLIHGMTRESDVSIWVGLGLALATVFIRQVGLGIFFGFVVAYPFWRGLGRKWFIQAVVPAVLAFLTLKACERGLIALDRLPRVYGMFNQSLSEFLGDLIHVKRGILRALFYRVLVFLAYLGLFTAPIALLLWPSTLSRLSRRGRMIEVGWVGGLTVVMTAVHYRYRGLMPSGGNVVCDFGVGARFLSGEWPGQSPKAVTWSITVLSVLGAILALQALARVVWRILIRPLNPETAARRPAAILLIATCALFFGPFLFTNIPLFDRYFLTVVPLAIALIWLGITTTVASEVPGPAFVLRPIGIAAGLLSLSVLFVFAAAGTHDYLDWSRGRWSAARRLASELAIPPTEIDGGWEYNNLFPNEERLYKNRQERDSMMTRRERDGKSIPNALDKPYRVAVSPTTGYEVIRRIPLSPWLPLAPRELVLTKKIGVSSPVEPQD